MTTRGDYAPEEWETLQFAPLWAFALIAPADGQPTLPEAERLEEGLGQHWPEDLANEVFGSLVEDVAAGRDRYNADPRTPEQGLVAVADVLDARSTPDEAQGFKLAVLEIAAQIAQADAQATDAEQLVHDMAATNLRYVPPGADPGAGAALRARFTPEEWETLELAPFWVVYLVAGEDRQLHPAERMFQQRFLAAAWRQEDALLRESLFSALRDLPAVLARLDTRPADLPNVLRVGTIIDAKLAPEEAASYKQALVVLARGTAIVDLDEGAPEANAVQAIEQALR